MSRFSIKSLLTHSTKNLGWNPFCVSESLWFRKNLGHEGGVNITICRQSFVFSQYRNISKRNTNVYRIASVREKSSGQKKGLGKLPISVEIVLSYSSKTLPDGVLLCFRIFLVSTIRRDRRGGGYHDFPLKTCCLSVH